MVAVSIEGGVKLAAPVCEACWLDTAHRTTKIKAHFFPRAQVLAAVAAAGSGRIG